MLGNTWVNVSDKTVVSFSNLRRTLSVWGIWLFVTKPFSEVRSKLCAGPWEPRSSYVRKWMHARITLTKTERSRGKSSTAYFFNAMFVLTLLSIQPLSFPCKLKLINVSKFAPASGPWIPAALYYTHVIVKKWFMRRVKRGRRVFGFYKHWSMLSCWHFLLLSNWGNGPEKHNKRLICRQCQRSIRKIAGARTVHSELYI